MLIFIIDDEKDIQKKVINWLQHLSMSDLKTVSRSQLFDDDFNSNHNNDELTNSSDSEPQNYTLPPPGFDFEIVDVEDAEHSSNNDTTEVESGEYAKEEKVEYFPLFSTSNDTKEDAREAKPSLVKVKIDDVSVEEERDEFKSTKDQEKEWDDLVHQLNANARPLSYYFPTLGEDEHRKMESMAVDGETILKWSKEFVVESKYKLIDLKEYNAKIDLYYKIDASRKKSRKRPGKKKRDARIFRKERLEKWKKDLKLAQERARQRKYRELSNFTKEKPKKSFFGENTKRIRTVSRSSNKATSKLPGKPVFRTE